jgi:uncharacterized membrane protein YccC
MFARWSFRLRRRRLHWKPVMSRVAAQWISLRTQVLEHRAQLSLSVRVTTAAVSSFILSHLLNLPVPLWAVLTAVILTQVSFGRSLKATIDYMVGTVGGAIYTGALATLVPHASDIALAGALVLAVGPLALLGAVNPRFNVATFTGVMVLLLPGIAHGSPIESAFYRVVEVAVGSITALAVSLLILPARAHSLAIEAAAQMLDLAARSIPELFTGFAQTCDASAMGSIQDGIGQAIARLQTIASEAKHERISFLEAEPELAPLMRTLLRLRHDLVMVGRAAAEPLPEIIRQNLGPPLARVAESAASYLRQSGEALTARRAASPLAAAEAALDGCAEAFGAIRRDRLTLGLPVDTVERIFALGFALEQLRHNFRDLERCVREAARRK